MINSLIQAERSAQLKSLGFEGMALAAGGQEIQDGLISEVGVSSKSAQ